MPDIYDRAKATAARQLAPRSKGGKGLEMTLTKSVAGEYDPETGTTGGSTEIYEGSALRETYDEADINGTTILQSDVKFIVSPVQLTGADMPEITDGDKITFDGSTYSVKNVSPWNYAGLNIGFEVQARE